MSNSNRTRTNLSDILHLYTTRTEDPLSLFYELECTALNSVTFTLNFEGSENFKIEPDAANKKLSTGMKIIGKVRPFAHHDMGRVTILNEDKRASLKMSCAWVMEQPDEEELKKYTEIHQIEMTQLLKDTQALKFPNHLEDPTSLGVQEICSTYGKNFLDLDFPPVEQSLYKKLITAPTTTTANKKINNLAANFNNNTAEEKKKSGVKLPTIEWKRAKDFMKGDINIFFDGIEASDIRQGALGDCWFLSALAALTEFPHLVEDLFPKDSKQVNGYGCYHVRFCKMGIWQTVRVDDYFPCYPGAGPIYSRCNGNELWVLLVEKAYAKLHGSYEAIKAGWAYEGMIDLTGAPSKSIRFDDPSTKRKIASGELWNELMKFDLENYIMSASTPGEDHVTETGGRFSKSATGLVAGHAYTLISAKQSSKGDRLVKLRNPWGQMEWNGDWSDSSPLWTAEMQQEIEIITNADDGFFWMCFEDLLKHFYSINVCMVRYPGYNKRPWKEIRKRMHFDLEEMVADPSHIGGAGGGDVRGGMTAGGSYIIPLSMSGPTAAAAGPTNGKDPHKVAGFRIFQPLFIVTLQEKGLFVVTLHQEDTRMMNAPPYVDLGVTILKIDSSNHGYVYVHGSGNAPERQNQTDEMELEAGRYMIIPTTSGGKLKAQIEKSRRILASKASASTTSTSNTTSVVGGPNVPLTRKTPNGEIDFSAEVYEALTELFTRMDVDQDGLLNKTEIDQYMLRTEGSVIEDNAYQWLLNTFENKEHAVGISVSGFIRAQLHVFHIGGCDEEKLWQELKLLGYNSDLHLCNCRPTTLVIHCTSDMKCDTLPYDDAVVKEAQELTALHNGEVTEFEGGLIKLYKYRCGSSSVTLMVENCGHSLLLFQCDCSESENVISHRGELNHEETIAPNHRVIMHHLMPAENDGSKGWAWSYAAGYMFLD